MSVQSICKTVKTAAHELTQGAAAAEDAACTQNQVQQIIGELTDRLERTFGMMARITEGLGRLSATFTTAAGHYQEGAYLLGSTAKGTDGLLAEAAQSADRAANCIYGHDSPMQAAHAARDEVRAIGAALIGAAERLHSVQRSLDGTQQPVTEAGANAMFAAEKSVQYVTVVSGTTG